MRSDGRSCGGARQAKRSVRAVCMGNNLYPCRVRPCGRNAGSQHTARPRAAEERISAYIADLRAERQRVGRWHRRGGITGRHCERLLHTGCAAQKSARAGRASAQTATGSAQRTESTKTDGSTRTPVGQAAVRRKFSDGMPQCRLHPAARHSRLDIRDGAVHCAAHRSRLCPGRATVHDFMDGACAHFESEPVIHGGGERASCVYPLTPIPSGDDALEPIAAAAARLSSYFQSLGIPLRLAEKADPTQASQALPGQLPSPSSSAPDWKTWAFQFTMAQAPQTLLSGLSGAGIRLTELSVKSSAAKLTWNVTGELYAR